METLRGSPKGNFETLDIMAAGWLALRGHNPQFRLDGSKVVILFDGTQKLQSDLDAYYRGDQCNANQFAQICKRIKGQLLTLKNGERSHARQNRQGTY